MSYPSAKTEVTAAAMNRVAFSTNALSVQFAGLPHTVGGGISVTLTFIA